MNPIHLERQVKERLASMLNFIGKRIGERTEETVDENPLEPVVIGYQSTRLLVRYEIAGVAGFELQVLKCKA